MRVAKTLAGSLLALSVLALSALPSAAQNWPTRPVKILLPLGPGSGADIGARLIAEKLAPTTRRRTAISSWSRRERAQRADVRLN